MSRHSRVAAFLLMGLLPALAPGQEANPGPRASAPRPAAGASPARAAQDPDDLKEQVTRTRAGLINLQELEVSGDRAAGARVVVIQRNEMGSSFYLESVAYALDGASVYAKADVEGDLEKREEFEVFNGRVVPGHHRLSVQMVYRGHGFGVFSYLEDYRFKVRASFALDAEPGRVLTVKATGREQGGLTAELKDRPTIAFTADAQVEEVPITHPPAVQAETKPAPPTATDSTPGAGTVK